MTKDKKMSKTSKKECYPKEPNKGKIPLRKNMAMGRVKAVAK